MTVPRLTLADELAEIRDQIARLKRRESALASIEHNFPVVPVFRPGWPIRRMGTAHSSGPVQPAGQMHDA